MGEEMKMEGPVQETAQEMVQETAKEPEVVETMADYANELEASIKAYSEKSAAYAEVDDAQAETWQKLQHMMEERTVVKVKVKEAVKGGVVATLEEMRAFIPASQMSVNYVEKLEDWVGRYVEAIVITASPEGKKLVLSSRAVEKERLEAQKEERMASYKAGMVVEGTVESLQTYGAFVNLEEGITGLLHISQISTQRIKHPSVVLKEGQKVKVKILSVGDGKISLSMRALATDDSRYEPVFDYKETGTVSTGLGDLLKGIKL